MNYMQALAILGIVAASLVFVGCVAALVAIGSERIRRTTDERSPEYIAWVNVLEKGEYDTPAYREAFDAWADSVGLTK